MATKSQVKNYDLHPLRDVCVQYEEEKTTNGFQDIARKRNLSPDIN